MKNYLLLCLIAAIPLFAEESFEVASSTKPIKKTEASDPSERIQESLPEQATDFTAPLLQLQFQDDYNHSVWGTDSTSNTFIVRPVIPIQKSAAIPFEQLIRVSAYAITTPKTPHRTTGLGDTQFFDLFLYEIPKWGRIGFGPMVVLPSSTDQHRIGQGKWQLGPAFAAMLLAARHWQFGFLAQNPYALFGNSSMKNVITLYLQPLISFHFRNNWYFISNAQMTFQWNPSYVEVPINIGIGKVAKIKGQPINAFIQTEWIAYRKHAEFQPQFTVKVGFNFLFPDRPVAVEKAGS